MKILATNSRRLIDLYLKEMSPNVEHTSCMPINFFKKKLLK